MTHEEALAQLRDIQGMDITLWQFLLPYVLGAIALIVLGFLAWRMWQKKPRKSDSPQAILRALQDATTLEPRAQAAMLQLLLKKHAIALHGRAAVAGLSDAQWLAWLDAHAPVKGFRWSDEASVLLRLPYQPTTASPQDHAALAAIRTAATRWVEGQSHV
jgi:hypothetical protein